ncbi:tripartite tricarboxylate transporter TctB family protein [Saccharopolyspora sp. NPDC050389]|uniref:tripartite tricarboxylate transporter TctB family protein n=1 Tax=Saccharopolyspora sp. NPDC050389 TaxID=3155516 RepID=UPI0033D7B115
MTTKKQAPEHADERRGPSRTSVVPSLALLAIGVAAVISGILLEQRNGEPAGPGLWPVFAGILLVATSAVMLFKRPLRTVDRVNLAELSQILWGVLLLAVFIALLKATGIVTACAVTGIVWLRFLAKESWLVSALVPTGVGLVIYVVFVQLLDVPLPVDAFLPR